MKRNQAAAVVVAILVVGGAGKAFFGGGETHTAKAESPVAGSSPVPVTMETAEYVTAPRWIDATGTVKAEFESPVSTRMMGRIVSVMVREGDTVRRGQPLVQLDARDLDATIAQNQANVRASMVGYENSRTDATMELSLSAARISEARSGVDQEQAALKAAVTHQQLVEAGPRRQERTQADLAVAQAKAGLDLAAANDRRMDSLYNQGAISRQAYETTHAQFEVAKAQYDTAVQGQSMAQEGSRSEEIRSAGEAVQQARAALEQAEAGLRQARASAAEAQMKRAAIGSAQAQVGQSTAALDVARVARDYATIPAPFDGVVSARLVDPGAVVSPGTPILKVQGGETRLDAVVPESVLASIHIGQTIPVELDALPGRPVPGRVKEIAPQGDPTSHTFVVKIVLPDGSQARAGMFGRARIRTGEDRELLVPASAAWDQAGLHYIYVVDRQNIARLRLITVGDRTGSQVQVLSGLDAGDRIVTGGRETAKDGSHVSAS